MTAPRGSQRGGGVPLEGFEHVLIILHSDLKRQNPRNYADFRDHDDIQQRLKTANRKHNAGKTRARITSADIPLRRMLKVNAGKF